MPKVQFSANFSRQISAPACSVDGATVTTVRQALESAFTQNPPLRGYVLDDQNAVRTHVVVFVDGAAVKDRICLSDPVLPDSEVYVMQALSGG